MDQLLQLVHGQTGFHSYVVNNSFFLFHLSNGVILATQSLLNLLEKERVHDISSSLLWKVETKGCLAVEVVGLLEGELGRQPGDNTYSFLFPVENTSQLLHTVVCLLPYAFSVQTCP